MHATQAIHYLTRHFISPNRAINSLSHLYKATGLLKIYRHFFSEEFAASDLRLISEIGGLHDVLTECLDLVRQRLFEIPDYLFEEMVEDDLPLTEIPIEPMFGEWWNEEFEDMTLLWQILVTLLGENEANSSDHGAIRVVIDARRRWQDQVINYDSLASLCGCRQTPLRKLCVALLTLDHSTGNPWLDATYECPIRGIEWTVRNVNYLREKWAEAQQVSDDIMDLNEWLSKDAAHIYELLALWEQALMLRP